MGAAAKPVWEEHGTIPANQVCPLLRAGTVHIQTVGRLFLWGSNLGGLCLRDPDSQFEKTTLSAHAN